MGGWVGASQRRTATRKVQPRPQGLLGVQNGGLEKTLANSRRLEIFYCFKYAAGFVVD